MEFTHRATVTAGETRKGDRQVLRYEKPDERGEPVGRVHPQNAFNGAGPWKWASSVFPNPHGHAETMEEALAFVKDAAQPKTDT
jgi:hypothetical protein